MVEVQFISIMRSLDVQGHHNGLTAFNPAFRTRMFEFKSLSRFLAEQDAG
jgi:hypothetical protein